MLPPKKFPRKKKPAISAGNTHTARGKRVRMPNQRRAGPTGGNPKSPNVGKTGPRAPKTRGKEISQKQLAEAARLREVEKEIERLEKEKRELRPKVAAIQPPETTLPEAGIARKRGSTYSTWFKAQGSFGNRMDWDAYAQMAGLLDEDISDLDAPAAFYSQQISGRVKWPGIVDRDIVIDDLNNKAGWNGDFRDIYPRWEYIYRIAEMIGGVPVRFFVHKARQPLTKKLRGQGWQAF